MADLIEKPFNDDLKVILAKIAATIRHLSIDMVEKANSGHPGLPLGCAELGAYLWGFFLHYNPKNPNWLNRDRFVLSAGHGSCLLYSVLHLSGYDLSLEDLKNFRQLGSKTPGHPESFITQGVETTTGPLSQGIGNAVGMALGLKMVGCQFNSEKQRLISGKVIFLAGDGCMMEGVSHETCALAGHLGLDNLIGIYDSNDICLDGPLAECCSEDTAKRFSAYGWDVVTIDGHDFDAIHKALIPARYNQKKPLLVIAKTTIGKGSPHKAGTAKAHGSPLGEEEARLTKLALGLPLDQFYIPQPVKDFFEQKQKNDFEREKEWNELFGEWARAFPDKRKEFDLMEKNELPADIESRLQAISIKEPISGRKASQDTLNSLAEWMPSIVGGSADLSSSDMTLMKKYPIVSKDSFKGRNIKFGVREFGMATMASGIAQTHLLRPFVGTFLAFSDYMRPAIRLAALMKEPVIYQFTHDSIFLGEDGPTHQPVEQLAALRAIPNLHVIRPAGAHEVKMAWIAALSYKGPTALILSRQNIPEVLETKIPFHDGLGCGAYIIKHEKKESEFCLVATGSEVPLALEVAEELEKLGHSTRVISMPCWELFEMQPLGYKNTIFGGNIGKRVAIEAGVDLGWCKYIGRDGIAISMETFGASAPAADLAKEFGFTVDAVLARIL